VRYLSCIISYSLVSYYHITLLYVSVCSLVMLSVEDLLRGRSLDRRQLPLSYVGFEHAASYKNAAGRAHGRLQAVNVGWTHHSYSSLSGLWLRRYMLYSPSYSNGPEICLLPITQVCSCFDTVNLAAADALSEVLSRWVCCDRGHISCTNIL
jgi:hypothetical protein